MGQPVVHFEFWSEDTESLSEFYSNVFDWKIRKLPEIEYHLIDAENEHGIGGGMMTPQKGPWPGDMTFYIDVDDLDKFRKKIIAAGGKVVVEEIEVPGVGAFALFEDPDGRVIGLWKQTSPSE